MVGDAQAAPAASTDGQSLEQRSALADGAAGLMRPWARVGVDPLLVAFRGSAVVFLKELAQRAGMRAPQCVQAGPAFQQSPYQGAVDAIEPEQNLREYCFKQLVSRLLCLVRSFTVRRRSSTKN